MLLFVFVMLLDVLGEVGVDTWRVGNGVLIECRFFDSHVGSRLEHVKQMNELGRTSNSTI